MIPFYEGRGDVSRVMCRIMFGVCHLSKRHDCSHALAAYPPTMDEPSLTAGIFGLATRGICGLRCRHRSRWALTPPFHPYQPGVGGYFLSHSPQRRRRLSVRKRGALCCPDFPLAPEEQATDHTSAYFLNAQSFKIF